MRRAEYYGVTIATGIAIVIVSACRRDVHDGVDTTVATGYVALTDSVTRVSDVIANPSGYLGDTITLVATVDDVVNSFAITLDEAAVVAGGLDNLLVISANHLREEIDQGWLGDSVRVTGTVRQSSIIDLEREIDRDLPADLEQRIKHPRPVVIAHRVERIDR